MGFCNSAEVGFFSDLIFISAVFWRISWNFMCKILWNCAEYRGIPNKVLHRISEGTSTVLHCKGRGIGVGMGIGMSMGMGMDMGIDIDMDTDKNIHAHLHVRYIEILVHISANTYSKEQRSSEYI
jgi:hypothetical protein